MGQVSFKIVEKVLLDAKAIKKGETSNKIVYLLKSTVIAVPKNGMDLIHFIDMLENQLDMSWWMIDYILGQNNIK